MSEAFSGMGSSFGVVTGVPTEKVTSIQFVDHLQLLRNQTAKP